MNLRQSPNCEESEVGTFPRMCTETGEGRNEHELVMRWPSVS